MSISIISSPSAKVMPVYNPIYWYVSSNNTSQPNFNYLFQLCNSGTFSAGNIIATVQLLPRPTTANALFNPARILESYLTYDLGKQNIITPTITTKNITQYSIGFGEIYGLLSTGTTTYSALTTASSYTFDAVLNYDQVPNWPTTYSNNYVTGATSGTCLYLTNQPRSGVNVRLATDRGCISFFNPNFVNTGITVTSYKVVVYHNAGGSTTNTFNIGVGSNIIYIPAGPWNINNSTTGTTIDVNNDYKYTIQVFATSGGTTNPYTEAITYLIDSTCNKYTPQRVMWYNRLGGWDFFNFNLVSKETVNLSRDTYKQTLPYNYTIGNRQTTVIDVQGTTNYELNSDWINEQTASWLKELMTSTEVYFIDTSGNAYPMQVVENSYYVQKLINDKLFNVAFNFTTSYEINSQRN